MTIAFATHPALNSRRILSIGKKTAVNLNWAPTARMGHRNKRLVMVEGISEFLGRFLRAGRVALSSLNQKKARRHVNIAIAALWVGERDNVKINYSKTHCAQTHTYRSISCVVAKKSEDLTKEMSASHATICQWQNDNLAFTRRAGGYYKAARAKEAI